MAGPKWKQHSVLLRKSFAEVEKDREKAVVRQHQGKEEVGGQGVCVEGWGVGVGGRDGVSEFRDGVSV